MQSLNAQSDSVVVSSRPDLWFKATQGVRFTDGSISGWDDLSGNNRHARSSGPCDVKMVYETGLQKALEFKSCHMRYDGDVFINTDYTIFVVEKRQSNQPANFFMGGGSGGTNHNLVLGYESPNQLRLAHYANDIDAMVADYNPGNPPVLSVFRFSQEEGRHIYRLFDEKAHRSTNANKTPLQGNDFSVIGGFPAFQKFYKGRIYEIIAYRKALGKEEREQISRHLIEKYKLVAEEQVVRPDMDKTIPYKSIDVKNLVNLTVTDKRFWRSFRYKQNPSIGKIRAITVFVDFEDEQAGSLLTTQLAKRLQKTDTLNSFYKQISGGKLSIEHRFHHGWKRMLKPAFDYHGGEVVTGPLDHRNYSKSALALFPEIDFSNYDIVNIATPPIKQFRLTPTHFLVPTPNGNKVGVVTLGYDSQRARLPHKILIHEYGHQMGLPDLYPYAGDAGPTDKSTVADIALGDLDLMAHVYQAWTLIGFQQYYLKWLDKEKIEFVEGESWNGTIKPMQNEGGTSMVIWTSPHAPNTKPIMYCIEQINPPPHVPVWKKSVIVYSVDVFKKGGQYPIWLHRNSSDDYKEAPLLVGEILDDQKLPFTVEVIGQQGDDFIVEVRVK